MHVSLIGLPLTSGPVRRFLKTFRFVHSKEGTASFDFFDDLDAGIACLAEKGRVQSVYYSAGDDESEAYPGVLPAHLRFDMTRMQVTALMGPPLQVRPMVDRWPYGQIALAVMFDAAGRITSVILEDRALYLEPTGVHGTSDDDAASLAPASDERDGAAARASRPAAVYTDARVLDTGLVTQV